MPYSRADLAQRFSVLSDEALLERMHNDGLTPEALELLHEEVERRGLRNDTASATDSHESTTEDLGNLQILTRAFDPTEAYLLRGLLESEGIPAFVADGNLVQANQLWAAAVGFVRVLVPESRFGEAMGLLARFRAGEFALADDMDVDEVDLGND